MKVLAMIGHLDYTGQAWLLWLALWLAVLPSYAAGENLLDVYTLAEKNDPRYNAARFNYAAARRGSGCPKRARRYGPRFVPTRRGTATT